MAGSVVRSQYTALRTPPTDDLRPLSRHTRSSASRVSSLARPFTSLTEGRRPSLFSATSSAQGTRPSTEAGRPSTGDGQSSSDAQRLSIYSPPTSPGGSPASKPLSILSHAPVVSIRPFSMLGARSPLKTGGRASKTGEGVKWAADVDMHERGTAQLQTRINA